MVRDGWLERDALEEHDERAEHDVLVEHDEEWSIPLVLVDGHRFREQHRHGS